MRIIAVPIVRRTAAPPLLTFIALAHGNAGAGGNGAPKASMLDRVAAMWLNLGKPEVRSLFNWRRRLFLLGERVMDQIGYEEWALKGIDVTAGPSLRAIRTAGQPLDPDVAAHQVSFY